MYTYLICTLSPIYPVYIYIQCIYMTKLFAHIQILGCMYVYMLSMAYRFPNRQTELAEFFLGNPWVPGGDEG